MTFSSEEKRNLQRLATLTGSSLSLGRRVDGLESVRVTDAIEELLKRIGHLEKLFNTVELMDLRIDGLEARIEVLETLPAEIRKTRPLTTVVAVSAAGGETEHAFRDGTKAFSLRCNEASGDFRFSWQSGEVDDDAGDWKLLRYGEVYYEEDLDFSGSLYLRMDSGASKDAAVTEWV